MSSKGLTEQQSRETILDRRKIYDTGLEEGKEENHSMKNYDIQRNELRPKYYRNTLWRALEGI